MNEELKPCPFCGGRSGLTKDEKYPDTPRAVTWYAVECSKCDAVGDWDLGESGAIEKWNTRPIEDALRAQIATLKAAVRDVIEWMEHAPFDYSNGVGEFGMDEGHEKGWAAHGKLLNRLEVLVPTPEAQS